MNWLGRYFVRAVIRRLAYIVVAAMAAVVMHLCASGDAVAGDMGEALSEANSKANAALAAMSATDQADRKVCAWLLSSTASSGYAYGAVTRKVTTCPSSGLPGQITTYTLVQIAFTGVCSTRNTDFPPGDKSANSPIPWPSCVGGCRLTQESISFAQPGGVMLYGRRNAAWLNETCIPESTSSNAPIDAKTEQPKPTPPECTALGNGQTACSKSNGDYCATASTGKTFCWQPTETGKKVDAEDAQVKDKAGLPVTPPDTVIQDKDWQRKEGHQVTSCVNGTCTTYNVTNFATVGKGTAKNGTGDNKGDGTGNTTGNGGVSVGGNKDNDQDSATDSGSCDTPPVCIGDTLKCLHLKYTWKIECNTKGNEISQGNGCGENDVPVCAGKSCKAEAYASVIQQWKARCAMEALGQGNAERAAGISNGDDAGVVEGIWGGESGGSGLTLRQDLVNVGGGGGSLLPDVEIEGQHWNVPQGFYDAIAAVRMVIIAMCTVIAMFVVGRNI